MRYLWVVLFVLTAVAANWATSAFGLVPIGLGLTVTAGTFFAGLALILRDEVQERWGIKGALIAVAIGTILSFVTSNPYVAIASAVAFGVSELVDTGIYTALRRHGRVIAILGSGFIGIILDTVIFLQVAGFPVTVSAVVGQVLVKGVLTIGAATWVARA